MAEDGGLVHRSRGQYGVAGKRSQGIVPAGERSEWTRSTDMATTMWATLRADGFKPPFSSGKDVMVLTAMTFELDKKTAEAVANLAGLDIMDIAFKNAGRGGGERMPIVDRIYAFAYLVGFLAKAAVPIQGPRGMGAMQRLQPLKASLERPGTLVSKFCLRKRDVAVKPTFTRMLAQFFNEDIADWSRAVMARGMHLQRYALSFPTPVEAGQVPLPGFPRTREWLTKAEVKKTGVEENW